jgi:sirohydrochlorin ferrochelatase
VKTALILIDHGSKLDAANVLLEDVAGIVRARGAYDVVAVAHMELAAPTPEEAFRSCVEKGASRVVIHPYFLSPGRHSQRDIPRMARALAAQHPHVETFLTEPLGLDERLADAVLARVQECLDAAQPIHSPRASAHVRQREAEPASP